MSSNTLSASVQQAIQAHFPEMVASELKDFIVKAEATTIKLQRAQEELGESQRENQKLRDTLALHRDIAVREADVEKRNKELLDQELTLLRREASFDAKTAEAELHGVKDTMEMFLRNVTVRQNVVADVAKAVDGTPSPGPGLYGTPGMLQRAPQPDVTTTTSTPE